MHNNNGNSELSLLVDNLVESCEDNLAVNHVEGHDLPDKASVENVLDMLLGILFPGYTHGKALSPASLPYYFGDLLIKIECELTSQVERAMAYDCRQRKKTDTVCNACNRASTAVKNLLHELPALRQLLKEDVQAYFERDPAAESLDLIIFCYPGLDAVATQRLAHILYEQGVPIIPRLWTERAHSRTGIDINPGAKIGKRFFIDHGTGIVIGESTVIGNNVSLYQGVTLGALSPIKGQNLKNVKRHPTIEDDVIIYAGATILGGETVIGRGSTIGGSVWLTESVPPGTLAVIGTNDLIITHQGTRSERLKVKVMSR